MSLSNTGPGGVVWFNTPPCQGGDHGFKSRPGRQIFPFSLRISRKTKTYVYLLVILLICSANAAGSRGLMNILEPELSTKKTLVPTRATFTVSTILISDTGTILYGPYDI